MKKESRNSNIELLRILCIIIILLHHSYVHSYINSDNINYTVLKYIQILGKGANNIFVIITGYYMINKTINKKSILKLILETLFYSYLILGLYLCFSPNIDKNIVRRSLFPLISNSSWFATNYLLLYVSIPFINKAVSDVSKKTFLKILIFMLFVFSILPSNAFMSEYFGNLMGEYFSNYIWFTIMFLVGGYIKIYGNKDLIKIFNPILFSVSAVWLFLYMDKNLNVAINNFPLFLLVLSIFMFFIVKKEWKNGLINYLASSILGVYLIHDNLIIRPYLWQRVNINAHIGQHNFWTYEILIILTIFFSCTVIDKVRQYLLEKPLFLLLDKIKEKKIDKINGGV